MQGITIAMKGRDWVISQQNMTETRKRNTQEELEKMSMGKFTFRGLFKNKQEIDAQIILMEKEIVQCNMDIEDLNKLLSFITILQGQSLIDKFKHSKIIRYVQMIKHVSVKECFNAQQQAIMFKELLDMHMDRTKPEMPEEFRPKEVEPASLDQPVQTDSDLN